MGEVISMRYLSLLALLLVLPATAQDYEDESVNVETNVVTGDLITGGNSSRAYGFGGLGDVDIRDCIYSYQVFILWQGTATNPHCVADKLDDAGKHLAAAEMRCSVRRVRDVYGTVADCIEAIQVEPLPPVPPKNFAPHESFEEHVVVEERHDTELEEIRQAQVYQFLELEGRLDDIDRARRNYAEDQRQKRVYAQGILDQLEQRAEDGDDPES